MQGHYQHLHYFSHAHVVGTNDLALFQTPPPADWPVVEKGGIALDVYIRNENEPFGFRPDSSDTWVSPDNKTQLDYRLLFNERDQFYDSTTLVETTDKAIRNVIENQRSILRKKLDDIIDF
jgi:hypothetical protein